ncbi:hypothetical protein Pmani_025231 [Petrolisthes manimaculis]|uniref:Uncharacterized protein n=1 Tax=Petrolisthes manimaculis TaxID=1843537 RepID=A0AAE1P8N2_9EUCA|nr:hypothetical protein Pmani_025231 [Petrolisthes manimaculis]
MQSVLCRVHSVQTPEDQTAVSDDRQLVWLSTDELMMIRTKWIHARNNKEVMMMMAQYYTLSSDGHIAYTVPVEHYTTLQYLKGFNCHTDELIFGQL